MLCQKESFRLSILGQGPAGASAGLSEHWGAEAEPNSRRLVYMETRDRQCGLSLNRYVGD
jgi:hypothetical protein